MGSQVERHGAGLGHKTCASLCCACDRLAYFPADIPQSPIWCSPYLIPANDALELYFLLRTVPHLA